MLLLSLGVLDVLKGLDFEESVGSFAGAAVLWLGRGSFCVRHDPATLRTALKRVPLVAASGLLLCGFAVWLAAPASASMAAVVRETFAALLWQPGPLEFRDELGAVDEAVSFTGLLVLTSCLWLVFRPLAAPRSFPDIHLRRAAGRLVRRHGSDTLAYFKLRRDQHYLFSPDRRAFLGYRVETGVLLVSGDPVGPSEAIPGLLRELSLFAEAPRAANRGARRRRAAASPLETARPEVALPGRRGRGRHGVRSHSKGGRSGRCASPSRGSRRTATRPASTIWRSSTSPSSAELDRVSRSWRGGSAERGFAMSLDTLRQEDHGDSLVLVGRDAEGRIRGFLHFAPSYGREAVSLSLMRRDRETPNGLTEFLVVKRDRAPARGVASRRSRSTSRSSRG